MRTSGPLLISAGALLHSECSYIILTVVPTDGLRGATVARLTPDQKAACSNHVGVRNIFEIPHYLIKNIKPVCSQPFTGMKQEIMSVSEVSF